MKSRLGIAALTLLLITGLFGCGEDISAPRATTEAPPLPPVESMRLDLGFFDAAEAPIGDDGVLDLARADALKLNWLNAAVRVAFINVSVATLLTPPTLAFELAVHTRPVVEPDGTFLWTYTWRDHGGQEIIVHLRGRIDGVRVNWGLRITDETANPPLNEFLWFTGESGLVDNMGHWIFRDVDGADGFEVARIDWDQRDRENSLLSFENIDPNSEDFRDTLAYRHVDDAISVEFYDASEGLEADISWDERTGAGSLRVPDYNDGERACWNENQEDVVCGDGAS